MAVQLWKLASRGLYSGALPTKRFPHNNIILADLHRRHVHVNTIVDEDNREDVREKGSEFFERLQRKGVDSRHRKSFLSLYQYLLKAGVDKNNLESQFFGTPDLITYPLSDWKNFCKIMAGGGVPIDIVFKNISQCPDLLQISEKKLEHFAEKLSFLNIGKYSVMELVQQNPQVFAHPPNAIIKRVRKLSEIFVAKDLRTLIKNNQNVITDQWDTIDEKISYIHEVMGLKQDQIVASQALEKSLLHIKIRHQFLYRAGLYKTPKLTKDSNSHKINADLSMITDTSNKFFVNKIARLTEDEYEVFCRMMKEEDDSFSDDEESDGSYSDEDEE
ncbi:transcription termination factor 4, mitochondrial [Palaemon carinicauda]|uniref:transcription termination factor 4, mitochondrial n=1 Tax=Palaemon carinicauda TaxID=392227 RepID=UPI0035B5CD7C